MSEKKSLSPKEARLERLRHYCRLGRSQAEACDIEGCDKQTAMEAVYKTDLKWVRPERSPTTCYTPIGLNSSDTKRFCWFLYNVYLLKLERRYSEYEISQKIGITPGHLPLVKLGKHNWTLGQITRLAAEYDMELFELLEKALDFIRKEKTIGF